MLKQAVDGVSPDENAAAQTLSRIVAYTRENPTVYLPAHVLESVGRLEAKQVVKA